jgi:hypothetical protein
MPVTRKILAFPAFMASVLFVPPALADPFFFSTGSPDGLMATATRPDSTGKTEIESADDFLLTSTTSITRATFTGLLSSAVTVPTVQNVLVEIYHVFPADSNVGRTSGSGFFSTLQVPARLNSPSDVELDDRDAASGSLTFTTTDFGPSSANNSVQPGGINPEPGQTTGGNGGVTGEEVEFDVTFATPFLLPADHYFFVPQVQVSGGEFLWLSAPKPVTGGTGPFMGDLQSWTRDEALAPDWLRVGTDIVGGVTPPMFNETFSLSGSTVPEPSTWALAGVGFAGLGLFKIAKSRRRGGSRPLSPVDPVLRMTMQAFDQK